MSVAKAGPPIRAEMVEIPASVANHWACLRFQESTGFVSIASDYGHWTYDRPPGHRDVSLGHFLARLARGYAGSKFLVAGLDDVDEEATEVAIRRYVRDQGELWENTRVRFEMALADTISRDGVEAWLRETTILGAHEMVACRRVVSWSMFWDRMWVPLYLPVLAEWPRDKDAAATYEAALAGRPLRDQ